jgi:hypothetical protein
MASDPPAADSLGDPEKMLDALGGLKTSHRGAGRAQLKLGVGNEEEKPAATVAAIAQAKRGLQQHGPN